MAKVANVESDGYNKDTETPLSGLPIVSSTFPDTEAA